ncbi:YqaE/Pmp3 family membrane protein [Luteolibacter algae]|uniref:YqaE/Pmp3 family membrane protein n=1 Tax=Luteolibacter algae TaxID=454151 RepID=A0ABW5D5P2_9BACT
MAQAAPVNKILLVILAFIFPPLAVGLHSGFGKSFVLNIILTIIMWLPGVIHALMVVL